MSSQITYAPYVGAVPPQIPGLSLWLDPTDLTKISLSNGNVISITDKASAQVFSGGVPPQYTSNIQNGQPVINFTGSNYLANTTYVFPNSNYTIFSIQNLQSTVGNSAGYQRLMTGNVATSGNFIFVGVQGTNVAEFTGPIINTWNDINAISPAVNNSNVWRIASFTIDSTMSSSNNLLPYIDGVSKTAKVGATGAFTGLLFGGLATSQFWNGYVGDFLIYNQVLTTAQRQQVEGYLAWKWGIQSLSTTHPYFNNPLLPNVTIAPNTTESSNTPFGVTVPTPIRFTQSPYWSPLTYSGLALWLDAADATTVALSNGNVTQWSDKSGNANHARGPANGITFDSINNRLVFPPTGSPFLSNTTMAFPLSTRTIFIVAQETSNAQYSGILCWIPNPNTGLDHQTTNGMSIETTNGMRFYQNIAGYQSDLNSTTPTNPFPKAIYCDRLETRAGSGFVNGLNKTNFTATFTPGTSIGFVVGGRWTLGSSGYFKGYMYEILAFNVALTSQQRQNVEGYLAWKWGLTQSLPSTHQNAYIPP